MGNSTSHFHPFSSQRVELLWQGSGLAAKWGRNCQKASSSSKGSRDTSLSGSIFTEKIWITETEGHSHFQQTSGLCLKPPAPLRAPKEVILGVSPLVSPILQTGPQSPPIFKYDLIEWNPMNPNFLKLCLSLWLGVTGFKLHDFFHEQIWWKNSLGFWPTLHFLLPECIGAR